MHRFQVDRDAVGQQDLLQRLGELAADALLTHAVEAQAEEDPEGLLELAARCEAALGEVAR